MTKLTRFLSAITITCALSLPASSQEITADTVVATVNGINITIGHMIVLRNNLPEQYNNLDDKTLFSGILDQVVQQSVLAQTVSEPSPAIALQLENERRSLLAGAAMSEMLASSVTDTAIQAAYEEQFASDDPTREFNASHILVETEEEALALIAALDTGADFAELAAEHSTGPSGPNGGQLGWFGPGMMVAPFEDAVTDLEDGQLSEPVQTQFGWHVIILNESRFLSAPALDEGRADIAEELQQKAAEDIITQLTAAAEIVRPDLSEIDPAVLRDTSLVQN